MEKKPWESKTVWINAAIAAGAAIWETVSPAFPLEIVAIATPLLNIVLRFVTSRKVSF